MIPNYESEIHAMLQLREDGLLDRDGEQMLARFLELHDQYNPPVSSSPKERTRIVRLLDRHGKPAFLVDASGKDDRLPRFQILIFDAPEVLLPDGYKVLAGMSYNSVEEGLADLFRRGFNLHPDLAANYAPEIDFLRQQKSDGLLSPEWITELEKLETIHNNYHPPVPPTRERKHGLCLIDGAGNRALITDTRGYFDDGRPPIRLLFLAKLELSYCGSISELGADEAQQPAGLDPIKQEQERRRMMNAWEASALP